MTKRLERIAGGIMVDGQQVGETLQCVHCGMHWDRVPGSGRQRGFCLKCNGVLCGKRECLIECKPIEKRLDEEAALGVEVERRRQELIEREAAKGIPLL